MKKTISLFAAVLFGLVLSGCGGDSSAQSYTVSATAGTGGAISPTSDTVKKNKTTSFTVTPDSGYAIDSVSGCGGSLSGSTYTTGAVTTACTVSASFIATHTVSTSVGTGGSISPTSATVNDGNTTSFTVTPNTGYSINTVNGCGGSLSGTTYTTGAVTSACTVTASFTINSFTVSTSAGANGNISPSSDSVNYGSTTSFTVTPDSGYAIDSVSGCGGSLSGGTYTTGAVTAACTVSANFIATYTVSTSVGTGGSISPSSESVNYGSTTSFTVTPNTGYGIISVSGCGGSLSGTTYTTGAVSADCTVTASFGLPFTWKSGSDIIDAKGVYSTPGSNVPGARYSSGTWIDGSGNLWLFGGYGYDSNGNSNNLNDLWEYIPSSNTWTWVSGSDTANARGVYSTPGSNVPGARYNSGTWTDASGNLWLFGGYGEDSAGTIGNLNDLWEYSPSSNIWTWVSGSDTRNASGVYSTPGSNVPGARQSAVSWIDASGNLWLFGGYGKDSAGTIGDLNDLWEYSPSSNTWTWVSGSDTRNASGVYTTPGSNVPGARSGAATWIDASGDLWLFGGYGYDSSGYSDSRLNDLWKYSPSSNIWTWVSGSDTRNASGVYGTQGVAAAGNIPGARIYAVSWTDASGNLWLFGGSGYDSTGAYGDLNDLWEYNTASGEWTWVSGSDTGSASGVYGTLSVAATGNAPGGREGATGWADTSGNLWLFGGYAYDSAGSFGPINDLWTFHP